MVMQASDVGGIVLSYGAFYGPVTGLFDSAFVEQVLRHRVPVIGTGNGWWSFVHIVCAQWDGERAAASVTMPRGPEKDTRNGKRQLGEGSARRTARISQPGK